MSSFSSAQDGSDYRAITKEIIFDEISLNPRPVYVPILNDNTVEYDEDFLVTVSTTMNYVDIIDSSVLINILDDDCELPINESYTHYIAVVISIKIVLLSYVS